MTNTGIPFGFKKLMFPMHSTKVKLKAKLKQPEK